MSKFKEESEKLKRALLKDPFPYWLGAIFLGLLNIVIFILTNHGWGITTSIAHWGAWLAKSLGASPEKWAFYQSEANAKALSGGFLQDGGSIQNLGIIVGALLAVLLASQFRVKKIKSYKQVVAAILGGLMMGYGARLSYG